MEEGRLGKGGFGEVVKARKKLDGQIYAIKKITQRSQASLTEILKEVRLLSQLSHPAVVRYYNTWVEEIPDMTDTEDDTSTTDNFTDTQETGSVGIDIQFATSTGGLDFMSSNANVQFGYDDSDSDDEDDEDDEDTEDDDTTDLDDSAANRALSPSKERNLAFARRTRFQRSYRTVMYISMEYCEKRVGPPVPSRTFCSSTNVSADPTRSNYQRATQKYSGDLASVPSNIRRSSSHPWIEYCSSRPKTRKHFHQQWHRRHR